MAFICWRSEFNRRRDIYFIFHPSSPGHALGDGWIEWDTERFPIEDAHVETDILWIYRDLWYILYEDLDKFDEEFEDDQRKDMFDLLVDLDICYDVADVIMDYVE